MTPRDPCCEEDAQGRNRTGAPHCSDCQSFHARGEPYADLQVRCTLRPCPWRQGFNLGPRGLALATEAHLLHVEQRHPRAWRDHLKRTTAATFETHQAA
jgi:hypothetical protein